MRSVLINFHIVKNAGGTIEGILEKNFKNKFAMTKYGVGTGKIIPSNVLYDYFLNNPEIKAFSSHDCRPPLPNPNEIQFFSILSIRHPVDRAFSVYYFTKRNNGTGKYAIQARKSNLSEYIEWAINNKMELLIDSQFRFLIGSSKFLNNKIEFAKNLIENCLFLVIVDRFDESMVVAEEQLQKYFENLDLSYIRQHVREDRKRNISDRIGEGVKEIDEKLMQKLIENNKNDFKIYDFANNLLDSRIQKISDFENKVMDFKKRCANIDKKNISNPKTKLILYSEENNKLIDTE